MAVAVSAGTYGLASLAAAPARADDVSLTGNPINTELSCDDIYIVTSTQTRKLNLSTSPPSYTAMYGSSHPMDTMALGPSPIERGGDGLLHAYHWEFEAGASQRDVLDVPAGATIGTTFKVSRPDVTTGRGWSGGEANQLTGEIYFSGFEATRLDDNYRLMKYDPLAQTNKEDQSGQLVANPPSDALSGAAGQVASDMAVDAEGNIYLLAGGSTKWLLRVVPGNREDSDPSNDAWTYSKVVQLRGAGGAANPLTSTVVWGMAFFNGILYAFYGSDGYLYAIDPISGVTRSLGNIAGTGYLDLATCQTAPVIRGVVYNDTNGDGAVSEAEGVAEGVTVELYNSSGQKLGERVTGETGEYSFILNSVGEDFVVRMAQPAVDGLNAGQTWASADATSANPVTAACAASGTAAMTSSGPCRGARADGIDPTTIPTGQVAQTAGHYSTVHMTTANEVAVASFGISAGSSWGDAPDTLGTTLAQSGPHNLSGPVRATAWLGNQAGMQADGSPSQGADSNATDDGVTVEIGELDVPLGGAVLAPGNTYTVNATVGGGPAANAQLTAWLAQLTSGGADGSAWGSTPALDTAVTAPAEASFDWAVPQTLPSGATGSMYSRFRLSSRAGAGPTDPAGSAPTAGSTLADTAAWVNDGEVEDYRTFVASSVVRLAVETAQYPAGPFNFSLSNVSNASPSSTTDSLTTQAANSAVYSTAAHVVTTPGDPVTITRTSAPPGWGLSGAQCSQLDGQAVTVSVVGTSVTVPGSATGTGSDLTCTVQFTKAPVGANSLLEATGGDKKANEIEYHEVTATINSDDGSPLGGQTVTFSLGGATGVYLSDSTCVTGLDGICSVRVLASDDGTYQVSATVIGPNGTPEALNHSPVSVRFVPGLPSPIHSEVQVTPGFRIANGGEYHTVTVKLRDANNNRVTGVSGLIEREVDLPEGVTLESVVALTGDDAGDYTFNVKSTKSGDKTITVKYTGLADPLGQGVAKFSADDPLPGSSTLTVTPTRLPVGTVAVATAYLADGPGNPVSSYEVCFETDPWISDEITTCLTTTASGTAVVDVTTLVAGGYEVEAYFRDRQGRRHPLRNSPTTVRFDPLDPSDDTRLTGTDADTRMTGQGQYHEATVKVIDEHGNNVPGAPVLFELDSTFARLVTGYSLSGTTNEDGEHTIRIMSDSTAGTAYVTARYGVPEGTATTPVTSGGSAPTRLAFRFVPDDVLPSNSDFTLSEGTRVADGSAYHEVTVTLRDRNNTLVDGQSASIAVDPTGTGGLGNGTVGTWEMVSTGVYRARITSTKDGIKSIAVTWAGQTIEPLRPPGVSTVEFVPGNYSPDDSGYSVSELANVVADGL
ncbi:MAG: Ig-like domain-containing protein, partial [Bifidobacteriaceae bacterium]|nr:Ig-like domain-containing protein [Bifidobacteriaceae bacterium]